MEEPSYDDFYRLDVTNREDAPSECDFYCGCDPMVLNKGDLQHMMKGKLLNYSDDGEYVKVDTKRQRLWGQFPVFTLEGNIYLEVKLAPHSFYAFHTEAQSIKGDDPDPSFVD